MLPEEALSHELNVLLPGEEKAVKYLITFRKELCEFLEESKFLEGEVNLKLEESGQSKKQKSSKEKNMNWYNIKGKKEEDEN